MRRRILLALLVLVAATSMGFVVAARLSSRSAKSLEEFVRLHRIENLRRALERGLEATRASVFAVGTPYGPSVDHVVDEVLKVEASARRCFDCHHGSETRGRLESVTAGLQRFQATTSAFVTARGDPQQAAELQHEAGMVGEELLRQAEEMSERATRLLEMRAAAVLTSAQRAHQTLGLTLVASIGLAVLVAARLERSITEPVARLVAATRRLAAGQRGVSVSVPALPEIGELAHSFNAMSLSLEQSAAKLEAEAAERREVTKALRLSEERYALAAKAANDGLWDWDLVGGRLYLSPRGQALLGYREGELGDAPEAWLERVHADDRGTVEAQIAALRAGSTELFENEHRFAHADGGYRWMLWRGVAVRDQTGAISRLAGSLSDVTQRRQAEEQLRHDALHDLLTGLPNRVLFLDRLVGAMRRSQRHPAQGYAVLFIDLDRFKVVNDSLGHLIGDRVLRMVGERLATGLRPADTVARLGGDEFGVLLADTDDDLGALQVAARIHALLSRSFVIDGREVFVGASIGAAFGAPSYDDPELVLRDADVAMYEAKARGRNSTEVFDRAMHGGLVERLRLETDLRAAIDHGDEFLLHFQPLVELSSGRPLGFEALVRWLKPDRGLLSAAEFIALAEASGAIVPLGAWVLEQACARFQSWRASNARFRDLVLSVNVSARQFREPDIVEAIAGVLQTTQLPARNLCLELTESAAMTDWEASRKKLHELDALGVAVHLDDFGVGYSSLDYLAQFPFAAIKIDRSFVGGLGGERASEPLVRAILSIAASLEVEAIAEGIETPEQQQRLTELGCRAGQGFLFSAPLRAGDVEAWVDRRTEGGATEADSTAPPCGPLPPCFT